MRSPWFAAIALLGASACVAPAPREAPVAAPAPPAPEVTVGGAVMDPRASIIDNLSRSADHERLVSLVRTAGLADRLTGGGPYTLFAATDSAFERLPTGTLEALSAPANGQLMRRLLNHHIVPGTKTRAQISEDARARGGTAVYTTLEGGVLRISIEGDRILIADPHGNRSTVAIADVALSNGIVHVVEDVLIPVLAP